MPELPFLPKLKGFHQVGVEQICEISRHEYGQVHERLKNLISDIVDLYEGRWPSHEACQVGYHNFDHALDVALAVARMAAGWNKLHPERKFPVETFLVGMAASFFHDTGYIKDKGDIEGKGGKYTFSHVGRSQAIAAGYLRATNWPEAAVTSASRMIAPTEFYEKLALPDPDGDLEKIMTCMLVSADLVAQMADVDYLHRITYLFEEFQEGYQSEGAESLTAKGVHVFGSAREILTGTQNFYDSFVLPRLEDLGRMDKYLVAFFGADRNPYQENITANLSGQLMGHRWQWQRLGEVLQEQGIVSGWQIKKAIDQQASQGDEEMGSLLDSRGYVSKRLLERMNTKQSTELLGEILMEMDAINPVALCRGLMSQLLPPSLLVTLSKEELIFLLNVSMLLQNYQRGSKVFNHILEMTNELVGCEASSILLADHMTDEIVIAIPTGPQREILEGERFPMDKGLAGWVYRHGQPVSVKNVRQDERFDAAIDASTSFVTKSIMAVPLHINGVWIGVIELLNKKDNDFNEHDMDLITSLVNIIGSALGSTLNSN